jgi:hypothetical protein
VRTGVDMTHIPYLCLLCRTRRWPTNFATDVSQRLTISPHIQRIAFLTAATRLRSRNDNRFGPGVVDSVATVRLLMLLAFGVV